MAYSVTLAAPELQADGCRTGRPTINHPAE